MEVFRSKFIATVDRFRLIVNDDRPAIGQRQTRHTGRWQDPQLRLEFRVDGVDHPVGHTHQHRNGHGIVLGLGQQVGGDAFRVG